MSLINDALKRASRSYKEQPREAATHAPMQAVEGPKPPSKLPIYLSLVTAIFLTFAGTLALFKNRSHQAQTKMAQATPAAVHTETNPVVPPPPVRDMKPAPAEVAPAPAPAPVPAAIAKPAVPAAPPIVAKTAQSPVPAVQTPTAAAPETPFPDFHVKAIIYRPKDPLAIIDGKTVGIGETVEGAEVTKVNPRSVVMKLNGQEKEIPLD